MCRSSGPDHVVARIVWKTREINRSRKGRADSGRGAQLARSQKEWGKRAKPTLQITGLTFTVVTYCNATGPGKI
jgi:hypothetical protein